MKNKNKHYLFRTVLFIFALLGASSAFAHDSHDDGINTGVVSPCQPLWLVNDHNNASELPPPDGQGVCVDVPVNFHHKVKLVFNLDSPVMAGPSPVGLRHMWMLGQALQHQIEIGNLEPDDISVIGVFHGSAMAGAHWPFKDSPVASWLGRVLAYNGASPAIHMQLEVCGVTLKGMIMGGAKLNDGTTPVDQSQLYPGILVNQGAIARLVYLQKHGYSYIQEGGIDVDN